MSTTRHSLATPKYQPLIRRLRTLPAEWSHLQLTAEELTALVGPLARSTLLDSYWRYSGTAHRNWMAAGFAARWDGAARVVTFVRAESAGVHVQR